MEFADEDFERHATLARDSYIHPAIERALRASPAPMSPVIFAQFLTILDTIALIYDNADDGIQQYRFLTEFALRKFLMDHGLDADGNPES